MPVAEPWAADVTSSLLQGGRGQEERALFKPEQLQQPQGDTASEEGTWADLGNKNALGAHLAEAGLRASSSSRMSSRGRASGPWRAILAVSFEW